MKKNNRTATSSSTSSIPSTSATTTSVICPKCGTKMAIPDKETFAAGIVIGKNSGLGTVVLQAEETAAADKTSNRKKKPTTPAEKIEALKAAGVDTSRYFTIPGATDIYMPHHGGVAIVDEKDPIIAKILSAGDAPVYRLFRRWVMAQVFHMLRNEEGFQKALNSFGYYYSWKVIIDEFHTQSKLWSKDREYYWDRYRWYNKGVLFGMLSHFQNAFENAVASCSWHGRNMVMGRWRSADDVKSITKALQSFGREILRCKETGDEAVLCQIAKRLKEYIMNNTTGQNSKLSQGSDFQNAYKGAGGFYTMQNLIRFHGCRFYNPMSGKKMTEADSIAELIRMAEAVAVEDAGYKMLGALKEFLKVNKIDIDKKLASWHTVR